MTPTSPASGATATSMSEADWASLTLSDAGISPDPTNIADMLAWMANEEPPAQWWGGYGTADNPTRLNPLNASLNTSSTSGLGSYPDLSSAAANTAQMIDQANMAPIKTALAADASGTTWGQAVISTPWASSHYGYDPSRFAGPITPGPPVTDPAAIGNASVAQTTGISLNPFTDLGKVASAISNAFNPSNWLKVLVEVVFVGAGAAMFVAGAWRATHGGQTLRISQLAGGSQAAVAAL